MDASSGSGSAQAGWYPDPASAEQLRYWDGARWTTNVAPAVGQPVPQQAPPAPARTSPPPQQPKLEKPSSKGFLGRVLWSIYALPITVLLLAASAARLGDGPVYMLDAIISLPQFVVLQLFIWDKRVLKPVVWKTYAVGMLAWQLAFGLVIEPMLSHTSPNSGMLVAFALQLPMFVALFLYAFGKWGDRSDAPSEQPKMRSRTIPVLLSALGLLVIVPALVIGFVARGQLTAYVRNIVVPPPPTYEVGVRPPNTVLHGPARVGPSAQESDQLRVLFDAGDYASLDSSLAAIQGSFEASSANDRRSMDAFALAKRAGDEARLDEWVEHSPSSYAARLARAEYQYAAGRSARGTDWSSKTTDEQFRQMGARFAAARKDLDSALKMNPNLVGAYCLRIDIANASGEAAAEDAAIADALARFPHSYMVYDHTLAAKRPRWGGSYREMERFARQATTENPGDLAMVSLFGEIYADQANAAIMDDRYGLGLQLYLRASAYGENGRLLGNRAWAYYWEGETGKAFADVDRCIAWGGAEASAYILRASIYTDRGNKTLAAKDIATAALLAPGDLDLAQVQARAALLGSPTQ